jgi:prolyl-tRNA editing enzyme YbaK/EbsC (Cys-tRNA(Pro) deacylase)
LLASTRLDMNGAVRQKLGGRRASVAAAADVRSLTGREAADLLLLDLPGDVPIWVDSEVMALSQIVLSNANASQQIVTAPAALARLPQVNVVPGLATRPRVAVPR